MPMMRFIGEKNSLQIGWQLADQILDSLCVVAAADQNGVVSLNHNQTVYAEKGDVSRAGAKDDIVARAQCDKLTVGSVGVLVLRQVGSDRTPAANVIPVKTCLHH